MIFNNNAVREHTSTGMRIFAAYVLHDFVSICWIPKFANQNNSLLKVY